MRIRALIPAALLVVAIGGWTTGSKSGGTAAPFTFVRDHHPLVTAVSYTTVDGDGSQANDLALQRIAAAGATAFRLTVSWSDVAPTTPPPNFAPGDPRDPAYRWSTVDDSIRALIRHHLNPIVSIINAPSWAYEAGTTIPQPSDLALFAHAAATRYSGRLKGLPRVRFWQVWLEPNLSPLLSPQLVNGQPVAAIEYRRMVNAVAAVVHAAAPGNLVIAGGTAPFRDITPTVTAQNDDWGPLSFARAVLCMSPDDKPTCNARVSFDVWAHHPYTSGGPTHHAAYPNDVSLGDLPKLSHLLDAAAAAGHIRSQGKLQLWVTEFSWDTNPPDPLAVPAELAARWTAQALYQLWRNGYSLVTWLQLRDWPMNVRFEQAGLYYDGDTFAQDRPKPLLQAFRFPVVAFSQHGKVYVWGRTPAGTPGPVAVQQSTGGRWRTIARFSTDRYGILQEIVPAAATGSVRVRFRGELSRPFSLQNVPDHFYDPFGHSVPLEPPKNH